MNATKNLFLSAVLLGAAALALSATNASAQSNTCAAATAQLQNYASQVNAFASAEHSSGIPMRCGGNPQCTQWWLGQLNGWYAQQTSLVNGWYAQIAQQCSTQGRSSPGPAPKRRRSADDEPRGLDENTGEEIKIDDEDKSVRIRIPSTPKGFK